MLQSREGIIFIWVSNILFYLFYLRNLAADIFRTIDNFNFFEMAKIDFNLQQLKESSITELYDAVKQMKIDEDRAQMEILWMENFLEANNSVAFGTKFSKSLSVQAEPILSPTAISNKLPFSMSFPLKSELCEKETLKLENEMKKKQKESLQDMKRLHAEIQEAQISCKEFKKAICEIEKIVPVDSKRGEFLSRPLISFLKDSTRNGAADIETIRLKTQSLKTDCLKQKRSLKKREELKSCLRPVDFELALIEKKKFQQENGEKLNDYRGLKKDVFVVASNRHIQHQQLLEASLKLQNFTEKTKTYEKSLQQMKNEIEVSEKVVDDLKTSVRELEEMNRSYEAPSVFEYIEKINECDNLKKKLKSAKRKNESLKISLKNLRQKHRKKLESNKNHL